MQYILFATLVMLKLDFSPQEKNSIDFGIFKLKEESKVEPVTQGSLFSRFKSLKSTTSNDSYKSRKCLVNFNPLLMTHVLF